MHGTHLFIVEFGFLILVSPVLSVISVKCSESTTAQPVSNTDRKTQSSSGLEHWVYPGKNVTLQCPHANPDSKVHWLVLNQGQWEVISPGNLNKFRLKGIYQIFDIQNNKLKFFPLPKNAGTCSYKHGGRGYIHAAECDRVITRYMCIVTDRNASLAASSSVIVRPTLSRYFLS